MSKIMLTIGFVVNEETAVDVFTDVKTEKKYKAEVLSNNIKWANSNSVNDDLELNKRFSVVSDNYIKDNIGSVKYVVYSGCKWKVSSIDIQYPRIIFSIGGLYNE